jgi:hypothetical protein
VLLVATESQGGSFVAWLSVLLRRKVCPGFAVGGGSRTVDYEADRALFVTVQRVAARATRARPWGSMEWPPLLGRPLRGTVAVLDGRMMLVLGPDAAPALVVLVVAVPAARVVLVPAAARVVDVVAAARVVEVVAAAAAVEVGAADPAVVDVGATAPAVVVVVAMPPVVGPTRVVDVVMGGAAVVVSSSSWRLMRTAVATPPTTRTTSSRKIVNPRLIGPVSSSASYPAEPHNCAVPETGTP